MLRLELREREMAVKWQEMAEDAYGSNPVEKVVHVTCMTVIHAKKTSIYVNILYICMLHVTCSNLGRFAYM